MTVWQEYWLLVSPGECFVSTELRKLWCNLISWMYHSSCCCSSPVEPYRVYDALLGTRPGFPFVVGLLCYSVAHFLANQPLLHNFFSSSSFLPTLVSDVQRAEVSVQAARQKLTSRSWRHRSPRSRASVTARHRASRHIKRSDCCFRSCPRTHSERGTPTPSWVRERLHVLAGFRCKQTSVCNM